MSSAEGRGREGEGGKEREGERGKEREGRRGIRLDDFYTTRRKV